jgi:L-rhamnose mutarotase
LPNHPIMRKWWDYMKDLMECHPDGRPVAIPLVQVFHMD